MVGNKLGGELSVAAQEGIARYDSRETSPPPSPSFCRPLDPRCVLSGATVVLGDRLYGVTIQRVFDALGWREKIKMVVILLWEGTY